MWAYFTRKSLDYAFEPGAVAAYAWGDSFIEFFHCVRCGCVTHWPLNIPENGFKKLELLDLALNKRPAPDVVHVDCLRTSNEHGLFQRLAIVPIEECSEAILNAVSRRK